ncbi:methyl-coenzyme M reductase glutamine C-methyltransferase [Methanopyrus kandleri]|uniref:Predicted Fe-S oxidoreductase n=2 Tax=Methanopyrus kandleri TaxID=2320 RepID=Q8TX78_METKA|nr:methyl-coenzyme M reductase glutamine C-methyltransferase [Methanopyrus kandleri]AAM02011.1 Predicted Fe-S oxidoreductase [Methanopyrus kandleri AV19]HII69974.1 TIGR04014 family B12-binding domain/radical SAM domain-containing protein [Methanopyrus kandleri]
MKVLVISPEYYTYGAIVVAGVCEEHGHSTILRRSPDPEALKRADVLILSLHTTLHLLDEDILEIARQAHEFGKPVIVGGPVSQVPELVLERFPNAIVAKGEAETGLPPLLQTLEDEGDFEDVEGIALLRDGEIVDTGWPPPADLDGPSPLKVPRDLGRQDVRGANVYIETHRGCPGACTFCQVPEFFGRRVRWKPVEAVLEEVRELTRGGARRFAISGGTVTTYGDDEEDFVELLKRLADLLGRENVSAPDVRADLLNERLLEAIRDYTIGWIFLGIESGSDRILRAMRKGITVDDVCEAVELARTVGVRVAGSFIVGYPGETEDDLEATEELLTELNLDDVFINLAEPIPGTELGRLVTELPEEEIPVLRPGEQLETEAGDRALQLQLTAFTTLSRPVPLTDDVFHEALHNIREDERKVLRITRFLRGAQGCTG